MKSEVDWDWIPSIGDSVMESNDGSGIGSQLSTVVIHCQILRFFFFSFLHKIGIRSLWHEKITSLIFELLAVKDDNL